MFHSSWELPPKRIAFAGRVMRPVALRTKANRCSGSGNMYALQLSFLVNSYIICVLSTNDLEADGRACLPVGHMTKPML